MKTDEIMQKFEYAAVGGPLEAIPVSSVIKFCSRILDRLDDIQNGMPIKFLQEEIIKVKNNIS